MNLPIRVDDDITYLLQIDRYRRGPRPSWHTFLPLDKAELYALDSQFVTHPTASQIQTFTDFLVQIYEGDLAEMGVGVDPYEWDFADRKLMRMICAAVLAGRVPDMGGLKNKHDLRVEHGTLGEAQWGTMFGTLVIGQ